MLWSSGASWRTPPPTSFSPKIDKVERVPWTAEQAVTFLEHVADDRLGPLFEVLIDCGLRRGEVLALRWCDIDIERRALFVRRTLSDVGGRLVFSEPKTRPARPRGRGRPTSPCCHGAGSAGDAPVDGTGRVGLGV